MLRLAALTPVLLAAAISLPQTAEEQTDSPPPTSQNSEESPPIIRVTKTPKNPLERLALELVTLTDTVQSLREQLAAAQLETAHAKTEIARLGQFMNDHDKYGDDFSRYRGILAIAEREARQRDIERRRMQREVEKAERRAKFDAARAARDAQRNEDAHFARYVRAGFTSLGLDVYGGRMAYFYNEKENPGARIEYDSYLGLYYRPNGRTAELDFSKMTISGSVLNSSDVVRNIGVAITFFDQHGNQVGSEIVQINNARPDVPYPFNATIDMSLNRAFTSSSTYVLYADPITP